MNCSWSSPALLTRETVAIQAIHAIQAIQSILSIAGDLVHSCPRVKDEQLKQYNALLVVWLIAAD